MLERFISRLDLQDLVSQDGGDGLGIARASQLEGGVGATQSQDVFTFDTKLIKQNTYCDCSLKINTGRTDFTHSAHKDIQYVNREQHFFRIRELY